MMDNFFCTIRPTINNQIKASVTYYLSFLDEDEVECFGLTSANTTRHFSAQLDENDDMYVISGGYHVSDVDIDFNFTFSLSSSSFPIGAGEWVEYLPKSNNQIRQKYQVEIWPAVIGHLDAKFVQSLFHKINDVESSLKSVNTSLASAKKELEALEPNMEGASTAAAVYTEHNQKLTNLTTAAEERGQQADSLFSTFADLMDRVSDQEGKITSIRDRNTALLKNLEQTGESAQETTAAALDALASTTTKNLAEAFKKRKDESRDSEVKYNKIFYGAIALAVLLAGIMWFVSPIGHSNSPVDYLQYALVRAPFFAFPVWLAIFASKKSSHAARLEEFYAQKQALAEAYQGYKEQIHGLYPDDSSPSELVALMGMNLASIGKDSSEVIDKLRNEKHSPLENIVDTLLSRVRANRSTDSPE